MSLGQVKIITWIYIIIYILHTIIQVQLKVKNCDQGRIIILIYYIYWAAAAIFNSTFLLLLSWSKEYSHTGDKSYYCFQKTALKTLKKFII